MALQLVAIEYGEDVAKSVQGDVPVAVEN
jgi:hypothetical protein